MFSIQHIKVIISTSKRHKRKVYDSQENHQFIGFITFRSVQFVSLMSLILPKRQQIEIKGW